MKRYLLAAVAAALVAVSCLFAMPALAETTVTLPTIDFGPLKEFVIEAFAGALMALATWISWKIKTVLKLKEDSEIRVYLDKALENGAHYAIQLLRDKTAPYSQVKVDNQLVAVAANYALSNVPAALKHFGIDSASLAKLVEARLGKVLGTQSIEFAPLGVLNQTEPAKTGP